MTEIEKEGYKIAFNHILESSFDILRSNGYSVNYKVNRKVGSSGRSGRGLKCRIGAPKWIFFKPRILSILNIYYI